MKRRTKRRLRLVATIIAAPIPIVGVIAADRYGRSKR